MPNHYHFLVRQDGEFPAGLLPQRIFNSYSKAYNKKYGHDGTLFTDHYHIKQIEETSHLLHLCRYIHGNPVKDGLVSNPSDWEYSNFKEYLGRRKGSLFDPGFFWIIFKMREIILISWWLIWSLEICLKYLESTSIHFNCNDFIQVQCTSTALLKESSCILMLIDSTSSAMHQTIHSLTPSNNFIQHIRCLPIECCFYLIKIKTLTCDDFKRRLEFL